MSAQIFYDATYLQQIHSHLSKTKTRSYQLLNANPGEIIVDAGCGLGLDTQSLAECGAKVIGVDENSAFLEFAVQSNSRHNVEFINSNIQNLPFQNSAIDRIRYERVFQHNDDHTSIILEAKRVLKVGGQIQIVDTDFDSISIFPIDYTLQRKLVDLYMHKKSIGARQIRDLPSKMELNGFTRPTLEVHNYIIENLKLARTIIPFDIIFNYGLENDEIKKLEVDKWYKLEEGSFALSFNMVIINSTKEFSSKN